MNTASKYPIPTGFNQAPRLVCPRFLFRYTRRGYFKSGTNSPFAEESQNIKLLDHDGKTAGKVNIGLCGTRPPTGTELELVVVSAGTRLGDNSDLALRWAYFDASTSNGAEQGP
jgi:hypothetical protein